MAGNLKDSKILAYKDMINQLNKTISTQTELIQSLQKTLEADRLEQETPVSYTHLDVYKRQPLYFIRNIAILELEKQCWKCSWILRNRLGMNRLSLR